jgi:hypothetical protein
MNLLEQTEKRRRIIHLVNYDIEKNPTMGNVAIRCAVPEGGSATAVRLYSPEFDDGKSLDFRMQGAQAVFIVPPLRAYGFVAVSW